MAIPSRITNGTGLLLGLSDVVRVVIPFLQSFFLDSSVTISLAFESLGNHACITVNHKTVNGCKQRHIYVLR